MAATRKLVDNPPKEEVHQAAPAAKTAAAAKGQPADPWATGQKTAEGTVEGEVYDPEYGWLAVTNTGSVLQHGGALAIGTDQYGGSYLGYQLSLKGSDPDQYARDVAMNQQFTGIKDNGNGTYTLQAAGGHTYTFGNTTDWNQDKQAAATAKAAQAADAQQELLVDNALTQMGFSAAQVKALSGQVDAWLQQGYATTDITDTLLPSTEQYKQRFPANAALIKAGYPALSPAEYMSTEQSMRQAAQAAGIPDNAYDPNKLIAANVSPSEFSDRITQAYEVINSNPQVAKEFETYYGIKANQLTAYILDPKQNTFALNQKGQVAQIGAAGAQVGQKVTGAQAGVMQQAGVTGASLQSGLGQIQQESQLTGKLVGQSQRAFDSNQILSAATGVNVGSNAAQDTEQLKYNALTQEKLFQGTGSVGGNNIGQQGIGSVAR